MVAVTDKAYGEVFNVGTGIPVSFQSLSGTIIKVVGKGTVKFTEFTQERKEVEPGDYYTNISKLRSYVGWESRVALEEGIKRTADFYRMHRKEYW